MSFVQLLSLALFAIFAENFVLVQCLGVRSFLDCSKKMSTAFATGIAVTVIMTLSSLFTWAADTWLLSPLRLDRYLQTVVFVLIIAALALLLRLMLSKFLPALHQALGNYLPLIAANSAILGVALLSALNACDALTSTAYGLFAGLGFTLALLLFTSLRERLEFADCPRAFEGLPIALITAGLLAMAFLGFSGLTIG